MNQWKKLDNKDENEGGQVYALAVPNGSIALKRVDDENLWHVVFCIRKHKQFTPVFSREFEASTVTEAQKTALWQVIMAVGARSDFWSKAFRALIDAVAPPCSDDAMEGTYSAPNSEGKVIYRRPGSFPAEQEADDMAAVALDCDIADALTAAPAVSEPVTAEPDIQEVPETTADDAEPAEEPAEDVPAVADTEEDEPSATDALMELQRQLQNL